MLLWLVAALVFLTLTISAGQPSGPGAELYIAKGVSYATARAVAARCRSAAGGYDTHRGGIRRPRAEPMM